MNDNSKDNQALLSVCLIVKNEERLLPDCLKSIADCADQIVVVDTGSSDRTVEIAGSFGAQVYHYRWKDDFAAARNESIQYAFGKWILWLDADERLVPESQTLLKNLTASADPSVYYNVCVRNLDKSGTPTNLTTAHRLFPNHKGIHFSGKIHEQIAQSAREQGLVEKQSGLVLNHLGYGLDDVKSRAKGARNAKLLKRQLARQPNDAYTHFTIAQHFDLAGQKKQAYEHYKKALQLKQFKPKLQAALLNSLADLCITLNHHAEARDYCFQSISVYRVQYGAYYNLYKIATMENDKNQAISALAELARNISLLENGFEPLPSDVIVNRWQTLFTLGRLYHQTSDFANAYQTLKPLVLEAPQNVELLQRLFDLSMRSNRLQEAEGYLNRLRDIQGNDESLLRYRALLEVKRKNYSAAIHTYQRILSSDPKNREAVANLIGLYGRIGNMAKAQQLLRLNI
jgi:glycosyltransferase involved in cell wall biosynthesis